MGKGGVFDEMQEGWLLYLHTNKSSINKNVWLDSVKSRMVYPALGRGSMQDKPMTMSSRCKLMAEKREFSPWLYIEVNMNKKLYSFLLLLSCSSFYFYYFYYCYFVSRPERMKKSTFKKIEKLQIECWWIFPQTPLKTGRSGNNKQRFNLVCLFVWGKKGHFSLRENFKRKYSK